MYGGSVHMEWVNKTYFNNAKVKSDYYGLLKYLISTNLGYTKRLVSFIKQGLIRTSHV